MAQDKQKVKEVKAYARYIHVSPQKLRLVAALIKRSSVDEALQQLKFSPRKAALPMIKVINSAVANAVHNFDLNKDQLFIKSVTVDGGPVIKKMEPRAQGRGFIVRKRTSHINVLLEEKPLSKKPRRSIFQARPKVVEEAAKHEHHEHENETVTKIEDQKPKIKQAPKSGEKIKRNLVDLKRRLFNRRSGV